MGKEKVYEQLPIRLQLDILDAVLDVEQRILEWTGHDCIVKIEKNVGVITIHSRTKCGLDVVNLIRTDTLAQRS